MFGYDRLSPTSQSTAVKSHHVLKYPWDLWHFQHLMVKETQQTQLPSMGLLPLFSAPIQTRLHLFLQDAWGVGGGSGFVICPVIKEQNCKLSNERCKEGKKKGGFR